MAKAIKFKDLWAAYPSEDSPCKSKAGKSNFTNQCAIRVGAALAKCSISTDRPGLRYCRHHNKSEGHVLSAEELASALRKISVEGLSKAQTLEATSFPQKLAGKTGIIFFKDYWMRSTDKDGRPTGDHIDLWNGSRMTSLSSWFRVQFGIVLPNWSDLEKAGSVSFWEVK